MTENEAIKVINDKYETFFALSTTNDFDMAMATAIQALEEIQQYRAIGTVEQLEWCKDASHWKELFKEKLEKYEAIGTVEEFKALKEKNEPKKAEVNEFDYGEGYVCGECESFLHYVDDDDEHIRTNYCCHCGTKIDWK